MKTNVVMKSNDRQLFGSLIRQETKTGFLNLSDLEDCFNEIRTNKGWTNKNIQELISRRENVERIFYILEKQNIITLDLSKFIELVDSKGIATTMKAYGAYRTTGARHTKTTWVNPYVWILIALELSPEFYATAITWITDKLILNRIEAGNFYVDLSRAISKFDNVDYIGIAKALNYIIFDRHEPGIRNSATTEQLKELKEVESRLAFAIDMRYIDSQPKLLNEMRRMYYMKYGQQKEIQTKA